MPNWCSNTAIINAPRPVIDELRQVLEDARAGADRGLLGWMRPMPQSEQENWYDWNVSNWGTKWEVHEVYVNDATEEDSITISFDSAWSPPVEAFRHWAEQDGRVTFTLKYYEPGMGYVGEANYDGDYYDDDCVSQQDDPARFEEIASDEWGYEPEEEPEPLTEWYEQGVKDKGLA